MQEPILEQTKACTKCGEVKPFSCFVKCRSIKSGMAAVCKTCEAKRGREKYAANPKKHAILTKAYYSKHKEKFAEYGREYRRSHPDRIRDRDRSRKKTNPSKLRAKTAVNNAVRVGKILKPSSCSMCGKECVLHGHHDSYKKERWLDVRWLCPECHYFVHNKKED